MLCFWGFLEEQFPCFVITSSPVMSPVLWHVDQGKQGEVRLRPPPIRLPGHQHLQQHLHRYPNLGLALYQSHQFHSRHRLPYMIADFFSKNKFSPFPSSLLRSQCNAIIIPSPPSPASPFRATNSELSVQNPKSQKADVKQAVELKTEQLPELT